MSTFEPEARGPARDVHAASVPAPTSVSAAGELRFAPCFVASHQLLAQLPALLFLSAWGACLFGGMVHIVLGLGGRGLPGWVPFVGAGLALAGGLPALSLWLGRRAYRDMRYVVRDGQLSYDEGFVSLEQRTLELAEVTRLRLRQSWLQRRFGLGTLVLARATRTERPAELVAMRDIPDPESVLASLRERVEARTGTARERGVQRHVA